MSGRREKAKRRAEGVSAAVRDGEREFEALVRARRAAIIADDTIRPLTSKRLRLAYLGMVLVLAVVALGFCGVQ